jgi:mono/diheme cytochrome c family protein
MTPPDEALRTPAWLDVAFAGFGLALVGLLGVAIARVFERPVLVEQRVIPALGVVDRCEQCHAADDHPGDALEHHAPERFGCTPCHGGQGWALTARDAHEARPDWERPLFTDAEREAACGRCHLSGSLPGAARLAAGRALIEDLGCRACHPLPEADATAPGPDLAGLRDAVSPAWIRAWLRDPAALDGRHRMPRFDLGDDDVEALVAFLMSLPGPALGSPATGDADRGRTAIATRRCATCHRLEGRGGDFAPSLDLAGAKLQPAWIQQFLRTPHVLRPGTEMPDFRLPESEIADIAAFIGEQLVPDTGVAPWDREAGPVDERRLGSGREAFVRLGCRGCHRIADIPPERPGMPLADVARRSLAALPAPAEGAAPRDLPAFVALKVRAPRAFDVPGDAAFPQSAMPTFRIAPEDALAIGIAVAALGGRPVPAEYQRRAAPRPFEPPPGEFGRLFDRFRCLVCHRIGGTGGDVSRVPLDGVGARLRRDWMVDFLEQPTTVRLGQAERMPVLGLTRAEAERLADGLVVLLDEPPGLPETGPAGDPARGEAAYRRHGCAHCHVKDGAGTLGGPDLDGAAQRLRPEYLRGLLTDPGRVPEGRHGDRRVSPRDAADLAAWLSRGAAGALPAPAH